MSETRIPTPLAASQPAVESTAQRPPRTSRTLQKLQRAVVDGLEDVKGLDIQVFDTEALSPLFERVIIASGNSNRQTRALASSVLDALREAGLPKPRVEGEDNGEWIIVDCGAVVAHIMQPAIRAYYKLEELWGAKPVRLRLGAPKPAASAASATASSATAPKASTSLRRASAAKAGVAAAFPTRAQEAAQAARAAKAAAGAAPTARRGAAASAASATAPRAKTAAPGTAAKPTRIKTVVVGAAAKKPAARKPATR
ncbi:MAG: hypothetical protein Fur007_19030 [Rhodoferax sp.]